MPSDPRPLLPRPPADPEYLQRLRQKAMARMESDGQATTLVTRRWSVQRFAFILAGAATGMLRAKPANAAVGARCNAPQYGATGLPGNPSPNPARIPNSFTSRENLKSIEAWTQSGAYIVPNRPSPIWGTNAQVRLAYYRLPSGEPLALMVIADPGSHTSYVVSANQAFYVPTGSDLLGCKLAHGELVVTPSIFKLRTPPDGDAGVVAEFVAEMGDVALELANAPEREIHIPLDLCLQCQRRAWSSPSRVLLRNVLDRPEIEDAHQLT